MATAEQLKALVRSFSDGDRDRFMSVAMQVAAHAARQGHTKLADDLRRLVDQVKARELAPRRLNSPTPLVQPKGELAGLLSVAYPKTRLSEMVLREPTHERLARVLREQRQHQKLREHGLTPRHRLLLVGPPGSGKTMTASALAGEMSLPLFTILLDGLITKFMGETAAKLRLVFDAIKSTRGVYLFDEFDALGGQRNASNDVGEIRRVLNSFLQFLEQDDSDSIVIAATNHLELLDHALFRRFDDVIEYDLPDQALVEIVMEARLGTFLGALDVRQASMVASGLSNAEIARSCDDAVKDAVLSDRETVTLEALLRALDERKRDRRAPRR